MDKFVSLNDEVDGIVSNNVAITNLTPNTSSSRGDMSTAKYSGEVHVNERNESGFNKYKGKNKWKTTSCNARSVRKLGILKMCVIFGLATL